jgi:hypothetical protein
MNMLRPNLLIPGLALALAGGAFAQGDTCATAAPLAGVGTFAFDTTGFTSSGFGSGACVATFNADGFYQWTAPAAGDFVFDTVGTGWDTKLSVWRGTGCAATCGDYNDDTYGLQSEVFLTGLNMGDPVLIQVGGYAVGSTTQLGPGTLNIGSYVGPCSGLPDDSYEDNDNCANAVPVADGTISGLYVSNGDKDNYSICVADGATLHVDILFSDAAGDTDLFLWDAADIDCGGGYIFPFTNLGYGYSTTDNESVSWTNTTGNPVNVVIEVNIDFGDCNNYDLVVSGSGCGPASVGTPFCNPANNNSTGFPAVLTGSWGSGVGSDLHLEMSGGVPGELAYLLAGNEATAGFLVPGGNGPLCLVGTPTAELYRYNVDGGSSNSIGLFDASGVWQNYFGTSTTGYGFDVPTTIPAGVPIVIMAGDTWHFQGWYRDTPAGSGQSNFSNGLSVTF